VVLLFGVFVTLSFLAQGKLVSFSLCSQFYGIGMACLTLIYVGFMFGMYFFTKNKLAFYKRVGYDYEYPLDTPKYFGLICLGAFAGGFMGGFIALGNSTTIIFTLVLMDVEPMVVSAIVGFQVVFSAMTSLAQALINGSITLDVAGFFVALTLIGGGLMSYLADRFVSRFERKKVNTILVGIVMSINILAIVAMITNIATSYTFFGSEYMISIKSPCG
jgi:hypothetical protein